MKIYTPFLILFLVSSIGCSKNIHLSKNKAPSVADIYINGIQVTNLYSFAKSDTSFLGNFANQAEIEFKSDSTLIVAHLENFRVSKRLEKNKILLTFSYKNMLSKDEYSHITEKLNLELDSDYTTKLTRGTGPNYFHRVWMPSNYLEVTFAQDFGLHGELITVLHFQQLYD